MSTQKTARRLGVALIALVPALGLVACGSNSGSSAASSAQAAIDSATSAAASAGSAATSAAGSAASSAPAAVQSATAGTPATLDDVAAVVAAVQEAYPDGVITDIDHDDNRTKFEVDVAVGGFEYDVDVVGTTVTEVGERDDDNDSLPTRGVLEVVTQALTENPDAAFDNASWDNGHWEVELDDANGNDLTTVHY